MILKGKRLLRISGGFNIFLGLILVFSGFFLLSSGMSTENISPDMTQSQLQAMHYMSAAGTYIIVMGVLYCISGFIGYINANQRDYAKKCCIYGAILILFCIIDFIFLAITASKITIFNVLVVVVPLVFALLFLAGGVLNLRTPVDEQQEKESVLD